VWLWLIVVMILMCMSLLRFAQKDGQSLLCATTILHDTF